jgi:beta-phosphoglucomutase-like phosphatase (HAD superfamily)
MLGHPDPARVCLFDLDGVLTQTAKVHAAAWKEMFDAYLRERAARAGEEFVPFHPVDDYDEHLDGKPPLRLPPLAPAGTDPENDESPATTGLPDDGRGWFRTSDLSRVKRALSR